MKFKTIEDLQSLIDNEIEESTELEYKSTFAMENPKWKEELAKDVSAMANSNGGTIIYGVREKEGGNGHAIPSELLPIPYTKMSKDKLSQLLSSNIQPVIDNVEITVIPNDDNSGFFVVQISQSNTAHQNKLNHQYFKRRNATIEAMEDYEIRDVMNRTKHPVIELEFELHKTITNITEKPRRNILNEPLSEDKHYTETKYELKYRLVNKGMVYAKYVNYFIYFPVILNSRKEPFEVDGSGEYFYVFGDNTTRDITAIHGYQKEYGPVRYDPLLPRFKGWTQEIELDFSDVINEESLPSLWYSIAADNAQERKIIVEWSSIKVFEKTEDKTIDPSHIGFNPIFYK